MYDGFIFIVTFLSLSVEYAKTHKNIVVFILLLFGYTQQLIFPEMSSQTIAKEN